MTRFFMTIPEASRLILEASLLGEPGDLFVLDMGEPVRIVDLARDLARLAGRDPDSVPIRYIGLRPGEKLHESLFYDAESIEPTRHPKVLRARGRTTTAPSLDPADVLAALDALVAVGATGDHEASARRPLQATLAAPRSGAGAASPSPVTDPAEPSRSTGPTLGAGEREAVLEVLDSGWLTTGSRTAGVRDRPSRPTSGRPTPSRSTARRRRSISPSRASASRDGDEVIVPTYTFAASAEVVLYLGRDRSSSTSTRDTATSIRRPSRPRSRTGHAAIEVVHIAGLPADLRRRCLTAAGDAAGRRGRRACLPVAGRGASAGASPGTIGRAGAFSFYATKTITTGEGGMLVTDDEALADRARTMRLHGISRDAWKRYTAAGSWYYEIEAAGFKYNLTDLAAAIGLAQLERAAELRARASGHRAALPRAAGAARGRRPARAAVRRRRSGPCLAPVHRPARTRAACPRRGRHRPARCRGLPESLRSLASRRARAIDALAAAGIGVSVHFIPLHLHPLYRADGLPARAVPERRGGLRRGDQPPDLAGHDRQRRGSGDRRGRGRHGTLTDDLPTGAGRCARASADRPARW